MKRLVSILLLCGGLVGCDNSAESPKASSDGGGQGDVVILDGLSSKPPANWKAQKPKGDRTHNFMLPKVDGDPLDAELIIFFFGKGGGGGVDANIQRWKDKFQAPQGKKIDDVAKLDKFKVGAVGVTYLDVNGTYLFSSMPPAAGGKKEPRPDHRMIGVIFDSPGGPYFMTLIGPARTVEQHKKSFDEWLKNFK